MEAEEISGKAAESAGSADDALKSIIASEVDIDLGEAAEEETTQEATTEETEEEKPEEKKATKGNGSAAEADILSEKLEKLKRAKREAERELHEIRQEKKKAKSGEAGDEVVLNDTQILGILEEHKDDPKVLLNTIKYVSQQMAKGAKKETLNESEIISKRKAMDAELRRRYPDFDDETNEIRQVAEKTKKELGIEEHPYGDTFAVAMQVYAGLPQIAQHWFEAGKKAAMNETADAARKRDIKDGNLTPQGKKTDDRKDTGGLTPSQLDTAKRLGFTSKAQLELYQNQILKNSKPRKED